MGSSFNLATLLVIVVTSYAMRGGIMPVQARVARTALIKKVDLPHQRYSSPGFPIATGVTKSAVLTKQPTQNLHEKQQPSNRQDNEASNDFEMRQKRSQHDIGEYNEQRITNMLNELQQASVSDALLGMATITPPVEAHQSAAFELENISPLTYYMLLQKLIELQSNEPTYRVRTPRLGRSIDFQLYDNGGVTAASAASAPISNDFFNGEPNMEGFVLGGIGGGDFERVDVGVPARHYLISQLVNKKSVPFKPRLGKRDRHEQQPQRVWN